MTRPGRLRAAAVLLAVPALLAGCSSGPQEEYCQLVVDRQDELTERTGDAGAEGLLVALPIFTELAEEAPRDIAEEWEQVVDPLTRLQRVLEEENVDPATFDPKNPPEHLDDEALGRIEVAADRVRHPDTVSALNAVEQHARDVCQTPLSL